MGMAGAPTAIPIASSAIGSPATPRSQSSSVFVNPLAKPNYETLVASLYLVEGEGVVPVPEKLHDQKDLET